MNQVSIIDILPKPVDKGAKFSGKITRVNSGPSEGDLSIAVGGAVYDISPVAACIGFSDLSRLSTGANVEGYVYGNDILAVRLIRGAGLFGILNPPWIEYVLYPNPLRVLSQTGVHRRQVSWYVQTVRLMLHRHRHRHCLRLIVVLH